MTSRKQNPINLAFQYKFDHSFLVKRILVLAFLFGGLATNISLAENCDGTSTVPTGQKKVAAGTATAHYDGVTTVKGGQGIYVKIKNENALGVSYQLTIALDAEHAKPNCTYKAVLLPKTSAILWGSHLAEPPIAWKVTLAVGDESDAGVLSYEVYSKPN